jgi:uncharacterized membrane protein
VPAFLGGLFNGILSALPIIALGNCCCCLWVVGGGMVAAYLQQQNQPAPLTVTQGARVGLLAGIVGAVVWLALASALMPVQLRFAGEALRTAPDLPPELRQLLESLESGRAGGNIVGFFLRLFFGSIVSAIGGLAGAVYFRNDVPPALGGPIAPPPLP